MALEDIDLEGTGTSTQSAQQQQSDDISSLDGKKDVVDINEHNEENKGDNNDSKDNNGDDSSKGELEFGTIIEFEGNEYTVDDNHNLIDKDGNIFKNADEVKDFLAENTPVEEEESPLSISKIIENVGTQIVDEKGKPVEFTDDATGVKAYLDKVIELRSKEIEDATINTLYEKMPIVKDFINYLAVNNGDYRGFGEMPDRTNIQLDENNEAQQERIVRIAFEEFGKKGDVDSYIAFLKSGGTLCDVAKQELEALQEKDKQYRQAIEKQAEDNRKIAQQQYTEYFDKVYKTIDSRVIGGYKLPESMLLERDGKKITVTPKDFFNYVSKTDKDGNTGYQNDLNKMTDDEVMNQELLDAWLHFTGGSYKDLVNMAIKEEQVKRLVLTAKNNKTTGTVRIKPKAKSSIDDLILG